MNNKKEVITPEEHRKYVRRNIFLFLLFFLPVGAIVIFVGIFSIENLRNKVSPIFALIILAVVLFIFQSKIIDKYAKSRQLTGGKLYSKWMNQRVYHPEIISIIFIVIVIIIAIIKWIFK